MNPDTTTWLMSAEDIAAHLECELADTLVMCEKPIMRADAHKVQIKPGMKWIDRATPLYRFDRLPEIKRRLEALRARRESETNLPEEQ